MFSTRQLVRPLLKVHAIHTRRGPLLYRLSPHSAPQRHHPAFLSGAFAIGLATAWTLPTLNDSIVPTSTTRGSFDDHYDVATARTLGAGAFGTVVRCTHRATKTQAAVKIVMDCFDEAEREKIALTCVAAAGGHANIVRLNEFYHQGGHHYLVVDFVPGSTLFDHVRQRSKLTEESVHDILRQVASAIEFMHSLGMVHCDLKPDNIMVTPVEAEGGPRSHAVTLIDFGSATIPNPSSNSLPLDATVLARTPPSGTKSYWSPEMCVQANRQVAPYVDMWSVGCILYIMLCGQHPFDPRGNLTEDQVIHNILTRPVTFDHPIWATISPRMKAIVAALLEKDPDKRMTAEMLSNELSSGVKS